MDDGNIVTTLRRLVGERGAEARAMCPLDARLALEILTSGGERLLASAGPRLLDELRAAGETSGIRERLLNTAAGYVERLAEADGWPLFHRGATLRAHAALGLAAADNDELRAAVFGDKPLALVDPAVAWEELMGPLLERAEEWTVEGRPRRRSATSWPTACEASTGSVAGSARPTCTPTSSCGPCA
jgi:hypothetical protein